MTNPFLSEYTTPRGTVPFHLIKTEHFEPAIREGIRRENEEISAITDCPDPPTFGNTISALEKAGELLGTVTTVMQNLLSAESSPELEDVAQKMTPEISDHVNSIVLNGKLFGRIEEVYRQKNNLSLTPEESRLLDLTYDNFKRNGAALDDGGKKTYGKLTTELSLLALSFTQNHLKETNRFEMLLTRDDELEGLPESALETAAQTAADRGKKGWLFTLQAPSYVSFMKYSSRRELRKRMYMAYNTQCLKSDELDNTETVRQLVNKRMQLAQLLGFKNFAEYALQKRMAGDCAHVYKLLNELLKAYTPAAKRDVEEVQALAREAEGADFTLMPWDYAYYSDKLKSRKFCLDDEALRPYFELSRVKEGVFGLATRLYGISFRENKEIPVYHPDVQAYEVLDNDGSYLAVLYADFHPREGKQSGAWMTSYKDQYIDDQGNNHRPHVSLTMNFTKPAAGKPALLTFSEVNTFLHEFGHALHGIFADTRFRSMSGTNVYWDFVELPSQIMENFATEKDFLATFARHYQTGEPLPDAAIQSIVDASNFNAGYNCLRQVSFGLLDMAWYTMTSPFEGDVMQFERSAWNRAQLLPEAEGTCMTVQFSHIMSGGYAAGYYSYKWAEALDADAFSLFKERGIFDQETARSFRDNILRKGGTEDPMKLYVAFRGQEPTINALLKRNGII